MPSTEANELIAKFQYLLLALMQSVHMHLNEGLLTTQLSWLNSVVLCVQKMYFVE